MFIFVQIHLGLSRHGDWLYSWFTRKNTFCFDEIWNSFLDFNKESQLIFKKLMLILYTPMNMIIHSQVFQKLLHKEQVLEHEWGDKLTRPSYIGSVVFAMRQTSIRTRCVTMSAGIPSSHLSSFSSLCRYLWGELRRFCY